MYMKKILKKTLSIIQSRWFIAGVLFWVLCGGALWWYTNSAKQEFSRAYTKYQIAAAEQQNASFTPGADGNPLRATLDQTLARLLTKETKVPDRFALANQGLALIGQMNKEVDVIGDTAPAVTSAIGDM